jgi:hypothetical protein
MASFEPSSSSLFSKASKSLKVLAQEIHLFLSLLGFSNLLSQIIFGMRMMGL